MPKPLYEQVADELYEEIVSGRYRPGDKLPSRRELCAKYGVSTIVIDRAMYALRIRGATMTLSGKGVYVRDDFEVPDR